MILTVDIYGLAVGGRSIGTIVDGPPDSIGKKAMIWGAAPGERVRCSIEKDHGRYVLAKIEEIETLSPSRIEPKCSHFSVCGGCDLQYLEVETQREEKLKLISGTIERHLKVSPADGYTDLSGRLPDYGYRNRITLHLDRNGNLGFYKRGSRHVADITNCPISSEVINKAITKLREIAPQLVALQCANCILEQRDEMVLVKFTTIGGKAIQPNSKLRRTLENFSMTPAEIFENQEADSIRPVGHFSQVNDVGNEVLIKTITQLISNRRVIELYAGAGNFSFRLLENGVEHITAVEIDPALTKSGQTEAKATGWEDKIDFITSSCEDFAKDNHLKEVVLLDPPRTGAAKVVESLKPEDVPLIVYVSCSLPTLTNDLKTLVKNGFTLRQVYFVDMFPQTNHVETISVLEAELH